MPDITGPITNFFGPEINVGEGLLDPNRSYVKLGSLGQTATPGSVYMDAISTNQADVHFRISPKGEGIFIADARQLAVGYGMSDPNAAEMRIGNNSTGVMKISTGSDPAGTLTFVPLMYDVKGDGYHAFYNSNTLRFWIDSLGVSRFVGYSFRSVLKVERSGFGGLPLSINPNTGSDVLFGSGMEYVAGVATARDTSATVFRQINSSFFWYGNTGLVAGNTFSIAARMSLDSIGATSALLKVPGEINVGDNLLTGAQAYWRIANYGVSNAVYLDAAGTTAAIDIWLRPKAYAAVNVRSSSLKVGRGLGDALYPYWFIGDAGVTSSLYLIAQSFNVANVSVEMRTKGTGSFLFTDASSTQWMAIDNQGTVAGSQTGLKILFNNILYRMSAGAAGSGPGGVGRALYLN